MGAAPPTPPKGWQRNRGAEGGRVLSMGGCAPHAPSRRSTRCARLWPTRPPSEFLSVGAAPPRPRRVGSATAAPRAGACRLWGAAPPRPHPGGARAARGSGPPARPRSFVLWGLRPHAPGGLAAQPRPRGRARVVYGGRSPPRPHPGGARAARGSGPPTRPRSFFLWGRSPHAPGGLAAQSRPRGRARVSAWLRPAPRWTGTGMRPQGTRSHVRRCLGRGGPRLPLDATRSATATWMLRGVLGTRSRADARGSERASA